MSSLTFHLTLLALFIVKGCCNIEVTLENLTSTDVFESQDILFKCRCYAGIEVTHVFWEIEKENVTPYTGWINGICTASGYLTKSAAYGYQCLGNGTFTVLMKNVSHDKDGYNLKCICSNTDSNIETIYVKVRVRSVQMNYTHINITVPENASICLDCQTSYSRPAPYIVWYIQDPKSPKMIDITNSSNQNTNKDEKERLTSSISLLRLYPNRTVNGWKIHCEATNVPNEIVSSSRHFLRVIYPPDGPPTILEYSSCKDTYKVIEGKLGNLSCYVTGGDPLPQLSWDCFNTSKWTVDNVTVRSYVTWTAYRGQESCSCHSTHSMSNQSANVVLDILYPPSKPEFTVGNKNVSHIVNIIRHKTLSVFCKSDSNPTPIYTWSGNGISAVFDRSLNIKNVIKDGQYKCTVNNTMTDSSNKTERRINTSSIEVEVLFPPSIPEFVYGNKSGPLIPNNTIDIIRGDNFSISCKAEGNPNPDYEWDGEVQQHLINITSIQSSLNTTCQVSNIMHETVGEIRTGKASAMLSIDVLYPPNFPDIRFTATFVSEVNITDSFKIQEGKSFNLTCVSKGRPIPSYKWYINETEISKSPILSRNSIRREESGKYTCKVSNVMKRTFGKQETGSTFLTTSIYVLFFADVGVLTNKSIVEGHDLSILCPVIPGNTWYTHVYWTRESDKKVWNHTELNIQNVTKKDKMLYTCTVYSELHPTTVGSLTKTERKRNFYLNVFYKSSVRKFVVNGDENGHRISANESTSITFICEIDSNPMSTAAITLPNGTILDSFEANIIEYKYFLSSCLDNGVYTCLGKNNYSNGQPGTKDILLDVFCTPMAQSLIEKEIRTKLYVPVTLQFTALANPKPEFTWERWTNFSWKHITNNGMFSISSSGLQSNLTVNNFTARGGYLFRLNIENYVGKVIQNFTLKPFDRPNQPTEFDYIQESLADVSVTLTWKAGFNGGTPQTFAVSYKSEKEQDWKTITLQETDETVIELRIQNLTSNTYYVFEIVAENIKGSSEKIVLRFRTKELTTTEGPKTTVPAIAGSISGVIAIGILVLGIFVYRKRIKMTKTRCNKRTSIARSNNGVSEMKTIADRVDNAGMDNVYKKIKPNEERGPAEKTEKVYEELKADKDSFASPDPIYTNLKL